MANREAAKIITRMQIFTSISLNAPIADAQPDLVAESHRQRAREDAFGGDNRFWKPNLRSSHALLEDLFIDIGSRWDCRRRSLQRVAIS